jgi:hypothetical protein
MIDRSDRLANKREVDSLTMRRRRVQGVDRLDNGAAIVATLKRFRSVAHALDEVLHLLREPIVPDLLVDRKRPDSRGAGLFDGVAITASGKGAERVAVKDLGLSLSVASEDFGTVVHFR